MAQTVDRELFRKVTGLTWDINEFIAAAETKDDKKTLLKKLDWYIPEGAYLAGPVKRNAAVALVEAVAAALEVELSEVFVDVDGDGDVDAYDVIDAEEPTYTITFVDWDGSVLETKSVKKDATPSYSGETPVREGYVFTGWDPTIVPAVADATYTAQYETEPAVIEVVFTETDLNIPVTKSGITISSSDMTYNSSDKTLRASSSNKTFRIEAADVQVTEIYLETNTTSERYKTTSITDDSGASVASSCVRDNKSYTILINDATIVNCKNIGGGVNISTITVKYKQAI